MRENLSGKTCNQLIVNNFSLTLEQQGTLYYMVCTVIMFCIILFIKAFVFYHVIDSNLVNWINSY